MHRSRDFMDWHLPWYSAEASLDTLLVDRYWTKRRGTEAMDNSDALMDLTVYGRQEPWEDSPPGWPQEFVVDGRDTRTNGRPIAQWSRLEAGRSDDLTAAR